MNMCNCNSSIVNCEGAHLHQFCGCRTSSSQVIVEVVIRRISKTVQNISEMDLQHNSQPELKMPNWNISDKDNHKSSHNMRRMGSSESGSRSSKILDLSGQLRRPSLILKKGLLKNIVTTLACLVVLDLLASQMGGSGVGRVEGAILRRSTGQKNVNLWERPCGDGRWTEPRNNHNNNKKKKNHVKEVFDQTEQILNELNQKKSYTALTAMDGDWDHYLRNFQFPDISHHFTFRKVHLVIQQYMAMFNMFATIAGRNEHNPYRVELKETFEKMQKDSRSLLCMIESVINGTRATGRRLAGGSQQQQHQQNGRTPAYRYITRNVMERKLKGLSDEVNEQNLLPLAKVVFEKYNAFVQTVSIRAKMRAQKSRKRGGGGNKVNSNKNKHHPRLRPAVVKTEDDSVQKAAAEAAVTKRTLEFTLRKRQNNKKNKKNNNSAGLKKARRN